MNKFIILATLIAAAIAAEIPYPKPAYPAPAAPAYSAPAAYAPKTYDYPPMPYEFAWAVKDELSYNDYWHQEKNDGKVTSGQYSVVLPDGRTQIVTYKADENGYVADVKYTGEPKYPENYKTAAYKPAYPAPAAAYPAQAAYPAKPAY